MSVLFEAITISGEEGYASDYYVNALYKVNLVNNQCDFLAIFPKEKLSSFRMHCTAKRNNNKIFFFPASGDYITVYDIREKSFESLDIPQVDKKKYTFYKKEYKFADVLETGGYWWIIPATYPGIIRFDYTTYEMQVISNWNETGDFFFRRAAILINHVIYAADGRSNRVLVFDTSSLKGEVKRIGIKNKGATRICKVGDDIWFSPKYKGAVVRWNIISDDIEEFTDYPLGFEMGKYVFSICYCFEGKMYFIPAYSSNTLILEANTLFVDDKTEWKTCRQSFIDFLFETSDFYYFREKINKRKERVYKIEKVSNILYEIEFKMSNVHEVDMAMIDIMDKQGGIIDENRLFGLENLIRITI